ncbi:unnamed protein product [Vicia faba]|uniref:Uncharacterized protein n=1 Tax=Vicia faba TaxID=3906 RepID=A0AAV1BDN3_VICFA|nr:unnamed protein product [Vicia faba]
MLQNCKPCFRSLLRRRPQPPSMEAEANRGSHPSQLHYRWPSLALQLSAMLSSPFVHAISHVAAVRAVNPANSGLIFSFRKESRETVVYLMNSRITYVFVPFLF